MALYGSLGKAVEANFYSAGYKFESGQARYHLRKN